jgi:hypothetical protein
MLTGFPIAANDYDYEEIMKTLNEMAGVACLILDLGNGSRSGAPPDPRNYDVDVSDDTYKQDGEPDVYINEQIMAPHARHQPTGIRARGARGGTYAHGGRLPLRFVDPFVYGVFVTKKGKKYHREGCRYLSKSSIPITLYDAVARKYQPCKICRGPVVVAVIAAHATHDHSPVRMASGHDEPRPGAAPRAAAVAASR